MGQIEQFWCLSVREFPEFIKNEPTFYSSSSHWPSVTIFSKSQFFLGHPVETDIFTQFSWNFHPGVLKRDDLFGLIILLFIILRILWPWPSIPLSNWPISSISLSFLDVVVLSVTVWGLGASSAPRLDWPGGGRWGREMEAGERMHIQILGFVLLQY